MISNNCPLSIHLVKWGCHTGGVENRPLERVRVTLNKKMKEQLGHLDENWQKRRNFK